jgi:aconitate hydratase
MIKLQKDGVYLVNGKPLAGGVNLPGPSDAKRATMAYQIMQAHDKGAGDGVFKLKFDSLVSHDITYVGIIQTARASGLTQFPVPYAMTNCHNSLCAVGGTINEETTTFSAFRQPSNTAASTSPPNLSVIHMYAREALAACGHMILGSDSHTRYGALGTMGIGEGGPEIAKQLLSNTYDVAEPEVVLVYLENAPKPGVGPHDVAIALVGAVC